MNDQINNDPNIPADDADAKKQEIRRAARRQRALERLGKDNPACLKCGETNPLCLELHHIAGRHYADDTIIVCRNCHRKLSDNQKDHPDKITEIPAPLETIAHWLLGLADLFELLVNKLREFAHQLIAAVTPIEQNPEAES